MSKTAQRKQSAFHNGYKIGQHIARNMGQIRKRLFNKLVSDLRVNDQYPRIQFNAARHGYSAEMNRLEAVAQRDSLINKLTGG